MALRSSPLALRDPEVLRDARGTERPRWWRELAFIGILYGLYSMVRNAAPTQVRVAERNAASVIHLEHVLHLDVEHRINAFVASVEHLAVPANYYYATLHFIVTGSVLVWLFVARPRDYRKSRTVLLVMTLLALVGYWLYPLAPPRLTPGEGFIDTVRALGTWGVAPSTVVESASNQYAAMPSMHVGWALWSGLTIARFSRRPVVRALGVVYPFVTLVVVIATGNHYVLDAVGALLVFGLATATASSLASMSVVAAQLDPLTS